MAIRTRSILGVVAVGLLACAAASAAAEGWHRARDDGLEAAQKSGKPVLVVTLWKDGV